MKRVIERVWYDYSFHEMYNEYVIVIGYVISNLCDKVIFNTSMIMYSIEFRVSIDHVCCVIDKRFGQTKEREAVLL
jgi:hypothetical protein